ncbi:hypothetical protein ACFOHY_23285 [Rhizobium rosettiformans]|uniref:hypothetical protein n=1 Tax=Rhizobium rosettiformans TaxID=1368430 RepID=UPI003610EA3E
MRQKTFRGDCGALYLGIDDIDGAAKILVLRFVSPESLVCLDLCIGKNCHHSHADKGQKPQYEDAVCNAETQDKLHNTSGGFASLHR